jgi:hypothetical protein
MRPLVLLDVDGVLNALAVDHPAWDDWQRGTAEAMGRTWPIQWSPTVASRVRAWQDLAELQWLTTWGHWANEGLHALLGLPVLEVAGYPGDRPAGQPDEQDATALAEVTAAARDELTGRWWKFDVVRRVVAAQPGRPLVWVDDDLAGEVDLQRWVLTAVPDCLLVVPGSRSGLTVDDLDDVDAFLGRLRDQASASGSTPVG